MRRPTGGFMALSPIRRAIIVVAAFALLYTLIADVFDAYGVKVHAEKSDAHEEQGHLDDDTAHEQETKTASYHLPADLYGFLRDGTEGDQYDVAILKTDNGNIEFGLLTGQAPNTVASFANLIRTKFYQGGILYRAEKKFVLQGGVWGKKAFTGPSLKLEYKVPNLRGTVSMARGADPNSATSEFAIQLSDNSKWLGPGGSDGHGYGVFAVIIDGWPVIDSIMKMPVRQSGSLHILQQPVEIKDCWLEKRPFSDLAETEI